MPFLTSNQQCQSTEDKPSQQTTSATDRFLLVCRSCETVFSSSAPGRFLHHRQTCKLKAKFHYTGPTGPTRTLSETHTNPTEFFWRPGLQKSSCGSGQARVVEFSFNHTIQLAMLTAASTLQQYHQCNYTRRESAGNIPPIFVSLNSCFSAAATGQTDGWTDTVPLQRHCSAYRCPVRWAVPIITVRSEYKIQALFKDFQGPKLHFSSTKIINKKRTFKI